MNLTDQQIRDTAGSDVLAQQAFNGDQGARFVIHTHYRRQNPDHPISQAHRRDTAGLASAAMVKHPNGSSHRDIPLMRRVCKECQS